MCGFMDKEMDGDRNGETGKEYVWKVSGGEKNARRREKGEGSEGKRVRGELFTEVWY